MYSLIDRNSYSYSWRRHVTAKKMCKCTVDFFTPINCPKKACSNKDLDFFCFQDCVTKNRMLNENGAKKPLIQIE